MKKSVLLMVAIVALSCSKSDDDLKPGGEAYTEMQEETFDVLAGSFQHVTKVIEGVEVKGEILTFGKRLAKPLEIAGYVAHGEGSSKDVVGKGMLSYDLYYFVTKGGLGLKIYRKDDKGSSPFKDCTLSIKSKNEFTLYYESPLPGGGMDTFYRMK